MPQPIKPFHKFYRSEHLPWLELRHSANTDSCFEPHTHDTHSIGCLIGGETDFIYRNQQELTGQNTLCLINAHELHSCQPAGDQGWNYLMLYVAPQWIGSLFEEGADKAAENPVFNRSTLYDPALANRFAAGCQALINDQGLSQESQLMELIQSIYLQDGQRPGEIWQPDDHPAVSKVAEYIRANYQETLTLADLAALAGLSPWHLQRQFRKYMGVSPAQFQHQCRIHEACRMLRSREAIADVAISTGYADQSHLNRWFRKFMDVTPGVYCS